MDSSVLRATGGERRRGKYRKNERIWYGEERGCCMKIMSKQGDFEKLHVRRVRRDARPIKQNYYFGQASLLCLSPCVSVAMTGRKKDDGSSCGIGESWRRDFVRTRTEVSSLPLPGLPRDVVRALAFAKVFFIRLAPKQASKQALLVHAYTRSHVQHEHTHAQGGRPSPFLLVAFPARPPLPKNLLPPASHSFFLLPQSPSLPPVQVKTTTTTHGAFLTRRVRHSGPGHG